MPTGSRSQSQRSVRLLEVGGAVVLGGLLLIFLEQRSHIALYALWLGLALTFVLRGWGTGGAVAVALGLCLMTLGILSQQATAYELAIDDLAEPPLLAAVFVTMIWHERRRQDGADRARLAAESERQLREAQQSLTIQTCHDVSNPLAIARGYAELICIRCQDSGILDDSEVVIQQVDRAVGMLKQLRDTTAAGPTSV